MSEDPKEAMQSRTLLRQMLGILYYHVKYRSERSKEAAVRNSLGRGKIYEREVKAEETERGKEKEKGGM